MIVGKIHDHVRASAITHVFPLAQVKSETAKKLVPNAKNS